MKRAVITVMIVLAVITVSDRGRSFPVMTEITLAEPVLVIGIDRDGNDVHLTLIFENIIGGEESESQKYTRSVTASTAAAALEKLKKSLPREASVSTADYFLIGEAAAQEDLEKYTGFLFRNNTLRLTASVFIVRGRAQTACEVLVETGTLDILQNFGEYSGINAITSEKKFFELMSDMASRRSYTVPGLVIKEHEGTDIAVPSGYAIFGDNRLHSFLDSASARGYNILRNKSVYSTIEIDIGDLHLASRLENAKRTIRFVWGDNDELVRIVVDADITTSLIDGGRGLDAAFIEAGQRSVILGEIKEAVDASKQQGCDFVGFGEVLRMRHPLRWDRLRDNWQEIYADVPVSIKVNSRLVMY